MEEIHSNLQRAVQLLIDSRVSIQKHTGISDIIKIAKRASSTFTSNWPCWFLTNFSDSNFKISAKHNPVITEFPFTTCDVYSKREESG